jgi:hypothetical protein
MYIRRCNLIQQKYVDFWQHRAVFFYVLMMRQFIFLTNLRKVGIPTYNIIIRVTRLGEFSPIGRLFTIGRFSKITEVAKDFGRLLRL